MATKTRAHWTGEPEQQTLLMEATAALQDLSLRLSPADGPHGRDNRLATLHELQANCAQEIRCAHNGPYLVTNAQRIRDWLGQEIRPLPQMALCRCGESAIKPVCDGACASAGFTDKKDPKRMSDKRDTYDGVQLTVFDNRGICQHSGFCTDRLATVFHTDGAFVTASGGRMDEIIRAVRDCPSGALSYAIDGAHARAQVDWDDTREPMIEPDDPLLAPLFANMAPDHPQRVARWLGEVFGGPKLYSQTYGGYQRMISQHLGKALTEEMRARWVELIYRSAQDAGLPTDPEFQAAFRSYIEWGSRLALENSQSGAKPAEGKPMPHWNWGAAGPPGSRVSALASPADDDETPVTLPKDDEPVSFEKHIRPLFRARDRLSMKFAFDLGAFDDVRQHADAILERLQAGTMPCDGAWTQEKLGAFQRWVKSGMAL
jgi:truncated hemoglobin YjbI/CDGSH-type Zn-finger protein